MKSRKGKSGSKVLAAGLLVLVMCLSVIPAAEVDAVCEKALALCLIDAVVTLVLSGPHTGGAYALGCLNGYVWCLNYYMDFNK
jgi:hypothetical protein